MKMAEYPRLGETVFRQTLSNGLEVVTVRKPFHAKSYAFLAVRYGGMDLRFQTEGRWRETPAGIAHYLEHKMFDMASENVMQSFARNGASDNAFTSNAMTAYYFTSTAHFYENLRILLRFVSTPYFTQESVDKEQGIIAQEIQETEDDPDWRVYANLMERLYQDSPARVPVVGSLESIRQITPQTLYDCHKAFYTPSNMILVCVGNVDQARVAEEAEAILPREGGPAVIRDYGREDAAGPAGSEVSQAMEVSMPMFLAGYKCQAVDEGEATLRQSIVGDLACDALFGDSSPLYTRLYEEGAVNSSLGGNFDMLPGAHYVYVGGDAKDPRRVFEEITRQARKLGEEGIGEDFYRQIRRAAYGGMLRSLNSFENIAVSIAEAYFRGFDYFRFPEVFDAVGKADVEAFLRENIAPEKSALSLIQPRE
ncbi:MAG: insulinase family protein [Oscillospiraceae bacterium]|jgi:predicted Zn-dependent peptidase|nr:insulinase family protein [Oscillospiraceae bacterium]MDE6899993.1 insulinase family protein [Oscillospiraceae bacterium]